MNSGGQNPRETLNPFQANRLRVTCQYIDKLLGEIEEILNSAGSKMAFPRYADDILPAQRRTIEDYISRIRAQLVRVLEGQRIAREKASIPASRAVHVHLGAIDIAVEELKPKYMRGYGEVPEAVATELNGIGGELGGLVQRLDRYLSEGVGEDLKARLERLDRVGNDLELLKRIEEVVRVRGLVEFRPSIAAILDRAEDKSFEIAVFGRVSSGKSSLLNTILETDALPVGVTPITAVPTRVVHAADPSLMVWFSEAPRKKLPVAQLPEFATEQQNPGNQKHVVRLVLALPSPALRTGITFVDTPGLGSLATSGARETLAYLPKCDLGVVLIDAGATLTADDLQTIMALQQAAVPVNVLLSKADLLSAQDRERIVTYVKEHIASECRLDLPVYPVSVVASCRGMLDEWFEHQITPLYARSQELRAASLRRKIGALRDSVMAALQARLNRRQQASTDTAEGARAAEETLRKATGIIAEMRSVSARFAEDAANTVSDAVAGAAKQLAEAWSQTSAEGIVPEEILRQSLTGFVQGQVAKLQREITSLALQLSSDLRQCAADLGMSDAPAEDEFQSVVRGSPVFEIPSFGIELSHPSLARLFGRNAAEQSVAKQISRQLPPSFYTAVEAYWQLVKAWSASVIGQLSKRFESYAENYRAQAEVALGGREATKEELDGIAESLASMKAEGVPSSGARSAEEEAAQ
jgi:GTP-binding protein EngB required for normal cell division